MKIYFCHSTAFDYVDELYKPIRKSQLNKKHQIIFPHEKVKDPFNSLELIPTCDLLIAEVTYPSTGLGIELGWANKEKKKIICVYKKGSNVSQSLKAVSNDFIEYSNIQNLIEFLTKKL